MGAHIDRGPMEGDWAPGYYYFVFEDPDGIRLEVNFIPGKGLLVGDTPLNPSERSRLEPGPGTSEVLSDRYRGPRGDVGHPDEQGANDRLLHSRGAQRLSLQPDRKGFRTVTCGDFLERALDLPTTLPMFSQSNRGR